MSQAIEELRDRYERAIARVGASFRAYHEAYAAGDEERLREVQVQHRQDEEDVRAAHMAIFVHENPSVSSGVGVSIAGLDRAEVFKVLFDAAERTGSGWPERDVTLEEARAILAKQQVFDCWAGRVLRVDLSQEAFNPELYDAANGFDGERFAERLVAGLRGT